ncbi:UPF0149 family protein [Aliidiomarina soli]|uniref:DUF1186 domain-containing protein n=1 Tax=Aliidiomarina soli TaxID=1928574 RepID=A0A432WCV7_9GAMM|nr:UPF0149 family protein [Aliidiomarina soli]RUO30239.1 hypothetical protein CWE14_12730 [Aliidiomarina soli]
MSHSTAQLLERFSQLAEPDTFDSHQLPDYELGSEDIDAAVELIGTDYFIQHPLAATHALLALLQCHDDSLFARALGAADEGLLHAQQEYIVSYALPYCDAPLIGLLDALMGNSEHSDERRVFAAWLLQQYAALHPEYYGRVAKVVGARLQDFTANPAEVNGVLVETCVSMQAEELLPLIQRAYQQELVTSAEYASAAAVEEALLTPETAFEAGLEQFMHTKELDEIRQALETKFQRRQGSGLRTMAELDGLLYALALSPTPVARSLWLALLQDETLADISEDICEESVDQLTTYYSEVKDSLLAGEAAPYYESVAVENLNSLVPWAGGFLSGFSLWTESDRLSTEKADATQELLEFLHAIVADKPLPEQYQALAHSDYHMIMQLMLQRAFEETQQSSDELTLDDDSLQDFFEGFDR